MVPSEHLIIFPHSLQTPPLPHFLKTFQTVLVLFGTKGILYKYYKLVTRLTKRFLELSGFQYRSLRSEHCFFTKINYFFSFIQPGTSPIPTDDNNENLTIDKTSDVRFLQARTVHVTPYLKFADNLT